MSFVVCGNGYGHLKRTLQVADKIMEQNGEHTIQVIGATYHQTMFTNWIRETGMNEDNVSFVNGLTETNLRLGLQEDYSFSDYSRSLQYIQEKIEAFKPDRIVSDNLAGVLRYNNEALLMGSFLWSDVLQGNSRIADISDFENSLLQKHLPEMIGVDDIAMLDVKLKTLFIGMPWFCEPYPTGRVARDGDCDCQRVLVTGGGTNALGDALLALASTLGKSNRLRLFVDSKLFEAGGSSFERFSFSEHDFRELDWIICRPGAGILTDAVRFRVPLCTLEDDNLEISHNAACVERLGIGFSHRSVAVTQNILLSSDAHEYKKAFERLQTGGAVMAARHILNLR